MRADDLAGAGVRDSAAPPMPALPDGVSEQLGAVTARLSGAPGVVSVVLLGSAARGELSAASAGGRLELFSDLELLVVTRRRLPGAIRRALAAEVDGLASGWGYRSPLFHVDLVFRERARLGSLPPFVFTHELRANGRVLYGPDVRTEIRPVTLADLDRRNTHEILMKRLWAMAEALPAAWLAGAALDDLAARALGVTLWRNALDVPTALLPDAGILLSTYSARVARWREDPAPACRAAIDAALGLDSGAFLAACRAARARAAPSADPSADHARVTRLIAAGLVWAANAADSGAPPDRPLDRGAGRRLARAGPAAAGSKPSDPTPAGARPPHPTPDIIADAIRAVPRRSRQLFNEHPVTPAEWLSVARQAVRIANSTGAPPAVQWLRLPRKGHLCAGLLELHRALVAHHAAEPDAVGARGALAEAADWLAPVAATAGDARAAIDGARDFADAWCLTRSLAARAFWRTVRLADPAAWRRLAAAVDPEHAGAGAAHAPIGSARGPHDRRPTSPGRA